MLTLLHISDLHFGPPYRAQVGQALLDIAPGLGADIIVASGDFTQRAKKEQFAAAREFLNQLPKLPTVVVPGNHDIPLYRIGERLRNPFALYRQFIADELEATLHSAGAVIVSLNSTDPWRRITNGRIKPAQLDYCGRQFAAAPADAVKIVVAHHHFAPAPDYDNQNDAMHGAKAALDRFTELGVEMVLGGHLHRAYIGNSLDVYPSSDRTSGIIIVQCGTSTSQRGRAREREKNSFNLIKIGDDVVRITHYMHFHEMGGFAPVSRHIFPRRSRHFFTEHHAVE
jgi:3',5'-cyclic AMP phosphodiesterase CpdA